MLEPETRVVRAELLPVQAQQSASESAPATRFTFLDRAVSWLAPKAGLRRLQYRRAVTAAETALLRYEGAMPGRRTADWIANNSDPNRETFGAMLYLRDRARDLVRNNPYAAKALSELVGNQVGTGILPRADTGNDGLNKTIDAAFAEWSAVCDADGQSDFYGLQWLCARTVAESGEVLVRLRPRLADDGMRVPLKLQVLEPDYLDHNKTMSLENGTIIQGVQVDKLGRRNFYWMFGNHPGSLTLMNWRAGFISKPIPADSVLHVYKKDRPGQMRGVTWFAPVMLKMRDLDKYEDAELVRKQIEACFAAFVVTPDPSGELTERGTEPTTGNPIEFLEPGVIKRLKLGEDVRFGAPSSTHGYKDYRSTQLGAIAAGLTLPYELLTGDMSAVNYSSFRGGMLGFQNTIEAYRWLVLVQQLILPIWRKFIDTMVLAGILSEPNYRVRITAPKFQSVDPEKDANAEKISLRTGAITWPDMVASHGEDPESQLDTMVAWNKKFDEHGLILDGDPRKTTDKGQERGDSEPAS
jgi:lambda family phage portal protein